MTLVLGFYLRCNRCKRILGPFVEPARVFVEASERGWETRAPSTSRKSSGRTRHYCPECVSKREEDE